MKYLLLALLLSASCFGQVATFNVANHAAAAGGGGSPSSEDFEETGIPSSGLWSVDKGSVNWDSTGASQLSGEVLRIGNFDNDANLAFGDNANMYLAGHIQFEGSTSSHTSNPLEVETDAGDVEMVVWTTTTGTVYIAVDGTSETASTTFVKQAGTKYYWWIDYISGGTCYFGISTTNTRPADGTDTSTAFADTGTADSVNVDELILSAVRDNGGGGDTCWHDEVYWDTSPLGDNPWGE